MRQKKVYWIFALSTFLLLANMPEASAQNDVDNQLWINYALTVPVKVNNKFTYGGDAGARGLISNYDWNQFLVRPNITYRFNYAFSAQQAFAWFGTFNRDAGNTNEFRSHQDLNIKWPDLGIFELFYRVRFEQRWFFYEDADIENDFSLRLRGLIGLETADIKIGSGQKPIYFLSIFEWFSTDGSAAEVFVNQTRFHLAFGHRAWNKTRYELHYIRQGSRLFEEDGINVDTNIFRIRFFHWINRE